MVASQSGRQCVHSDELVVSISFVNLAVFHGSHMVELAIVGRYQGVQPSISAAMGRAHSKMQVGWEYSE